MDSLPKSLELVSYDEFGQLDEVCSSGGCHFERLDKRLWVLSCSMADGSEVVISIDGDARLVEVREPHPQQKR